LLLEGCPYSEIARQRNTSVRTVANQVAAAFTRLHVSGRAQLLASTAQMLSAAPPAGSGG
jgi:DNA-binding NarL/FixJ family response regulator